MASEELLIKAMTWQYPEEIPVSVGVLPAVLLKHGEKMADIMREYPQFFGTIKDGYSAEDHWYPQRYHVGSYTDEWGCVWENIGEGQDAIVKGHPLPNREDILTLKIPENRDGSIPHGFLYLRLLDLRGFEEAMTDFAEECPELRILIDKVTEHNCIQTAVLADRPGKVLYYGDDLGMQHGLAVGPEKWRKYLKPAFKKIFGVARAAGKLVYLHTDGCIWEIIPDLFEAGTDMVNPQFRANGLDNLARVCKGKYPINLDLDRQMFPFARPGECADHVKRCVEALYLPQGGLGLSIEIGPDVPLPNVKALLRAADECRFYR
ncbi:MAG: hypothetical protein FWC55_02540 [Firmicutes bacterium]|nr:hypothetical protein [Bacillota bacterium]